MYTCTKIKKAVCQRVLFYSGLVGAASEAVGSETAAAAAGASELEASGAAGAASADASSAAGAAVVGASAVSMGSASSTFSARKAKDLSETY